MGFSDSRTVGPCSKKEQWAAGTHLVPDTPKHLGGDQGQATRHLTEAHRSDFVHDERNDRSGRSPTAAFAKVEAETTNSHMLFRLGGGGWERIPTRLA